MRPIRRPVLRLTSLALLVLLPLLAAKAQQTRKRSEVEFLPVETRSQEPSPLTWGPYEVSLGLEVGHQQSVVEGNNEVYRAQLNYSDGLRLFDFNLRGKGRANAFFSDFYLQGAGWGGDPGNRLRFGASKEKWFDFRGRYRRTDYFWVFPGFARDQHRNDQQRRLQDYELTLFPKRPVRVRMGYTRNSSFGLTFTTFQFGLDAFQLFEPIRQTHDEYRAGLEWASRDWKVFFEQGYRFFRNDRFLRLPEEFNPGNVPDDGVTLTGTERLHPIRGRIPFTRLTLSGRPHPGLDFSARLLYSDAETDATRFEINTTPAGAQELEIITRTTAGAGRPQTRVDTALTWRALRRLRISNAFQFDRYSIAGAQSTEQEFFFPSTGSGIVLETNPRRQLEVESYWNRLEGHYDLTSWLGVRGGFFYQRQEVRRVKLDDALPVDAEKANPNRRSFLFGFLFRLRPTLSVFLDWERGDHTGVITRLTPANRNRLRIRGRWAPARGVNVSTSWFLSDNSNSNLPTALNPQGRHRARSRGFTLDLQLTRFSRGYLNAGYRRHDISALTDVLFFVNFVPQAGESVFIANNNYAYIDLGGRLVGNLYADAGYRVVSNTGTFPPSDAVETCDPFVPGACDNRTGLDPLRVNFGGLNFHQPHLSLRYQFSENLSWSGGWRWYGYNVKQGTLSDYKSHLVTNSLVLRF